MAHSVVEKSSNEKDVPHTDVLSSLPSAGSPTAEGGLINASGHRQQLERNFGLMSIIAYAITAGNTWVSLGGTIVSLLSPLVSGPVKETSR